LFLAKRFEEERLIIQQRKRDREEQHLYLYVRIITQTQFTAHQGFDLASWDDKDSLPEAQPIGFRFKKAKRMGELVEYIAKEQEYEPEQLRLWVMVNRQNKTVRPDQPLTDLDKSIVLHFSGM
jgi:ubiquitin carboxyl-terminal hydrolase 7